MAGRSDVAAHQQFIDDYGVGALTHVYDDSGDFWASLGVTGQPAWAFIDDSGEVRIRRGSLGAEGLEAEIDTLLAS